MSSSETEDIEKILFYRVTDNYINFLHSHDDKVQYNDRRGNLRPYIGILLNIGDHQYFAPLSSYENKPRYKKKNKSFDKVYDDPAKDPVAIIKYNCMIPFLESEFTYVDFKDFEHDPKYRSLLEAEYQYIKTHRSTILSNARKLYDEVSKGRGYFYDSSVKFMNLERIYRDFNLISST
ncbi:Endoribonuclease ToxN [Paenibacillus solanacearum]|uniref:Endoribonuclease ToxN n=1 Tax=Paenibacillus solanacearum TaxID=2048548 RepID=A0A916KAE4_9BACL|nr:type III toxin-antitoxin system ToxN/AbiQ family toxin [Paenibacillus solanacearum]CAG7652446.1 Endoribonuclease ToxN [Paenibacillus solanacearum]